MESELEIGSRHAIRVGAIARELATAMGFDEAAQLRLQAAGRHHECATELLIGDGFSRLAADVLGQALAAEAPHLVDPETFALLRAFADPQRITCAVAREVELLHIADAIDQEMEFEPYRDGVTVEEDSPYASAGLAELRCAPHEDLRKIIPRMPVFPAAALRAVGTLLRPDADRDAVEGVAGSDPVLAGTLVSVANSALYSPRQEIRSLPRAISHIGTDPAKAVLLAAMLRPVFATPALQPNWRHALEAADAARQLAELSGAIQPEEATLAALVHDIGVLAVSLAHPAARRRCERLIAAGIPRRGAEWLSFGFDHAEVSGAVLEIWRFPASIVDAVRHHHSPERAGSDLAALLYLVEFWTCSEEDIPSAGRLSSAAHRLGITVGAITSMKAEHRLTDLLPV